jgi:hypothetical protein
LDAVSSSCSNSAVRVAIKRVMLPFNVCC